MNTLIKTSQIYEDNAILGESGIVYELLLDWHDQ